MIRRALTMTAVMVSMIVSSKTETSAQAPSDRVLRVEPNQVHFGDTIVVGGTGYEPGAREYFMVACPSLMSGLGYPYIGPMGNHVQQENAWRTDSRGQFAGWFLPIVPAVVMGSKLPVTCKVYASYRNNWVGTNSPGTFTILPPSAPLDRCSQRMCVSAHLDPPRVHPGMMGTLSVSSWPGAQVDVTVTYPHAKTQGRAFHSSAHLDWGGHHRFRWPVKVSLPATTQSVKALVKLHAHLEDRQRTVMYNVVVIR